MHSDYATGWTVAELAFVPGMGRDFSLHDASRPDLGFKRPTNQSTLGTVSQGAKSDHCPFSADIEHTDLQLFKVWCLIS
jgi:hypothetical protein